MRTCNILLEKERVDEMNPNNGKTKVSGPINIQKLTLKKEYTLWSKYDSTKTAAAPEISEKEHEEQTMSGERLLASDI